MPHRVSAPSNIFPSDSRARLLSAAERLWLVADRLAPQPFVIQFVAEGEGDLTLDALTAAVQRAAAAHPGAAVRLNGILGWTRWRATGESPPVLEVDGSTWDGRSPDGASFLYRALDPVGGHSCEVLLAVGDRARVVVRVHHAVMDGVATREFALDIFRALRQESLVGSSAGPLTEQDISRRLPQSKEKLTGAEFASITGAPDQSEGSTWSRVTVQPRSGRLLARAMSALIRAGAEHSDGPWCVGIPVDIRRHQPGVRSSANLTGLLRFQGRLQDFEADDIHCRMSEWLEQKRECLTAVSGDRIRWVPLPLLAFLIRAGTTAARKKGGYANSAFLSNLGRQPLAGFAAPGWRPTGAFVLPPPLRTLSVFLVMMGHEGGLEICASSQRNMASGGRLQRVLEAIQSELT